MLHKSFFKTMIGYLTNLGYLSDNPFEGNPDYPDYWILLQSEPTFDNWASLEATYGGYARQHYYRNPTIWMLNDGPPFFAGNRNLITFPAPTSDAGQVLSHWGWLYPVAGSGGASYGLVVAGPLSNPITTEIGQTIIFPVNSITVKAPY
ncbi:MAG: hypothetical protein EKK48_31040 [Candidatus Melainabacteria bacterium]|nr:MAG: hypothetical protein EKK48_31040 [Candidatus Melainabacteria bacterium]